MGLFCCLMQLKKHDMGSASEMLFCRTTSFGTKAFRFLT